jgi:hypothetical protein
LDYGVVCYDRERDISISSLFFLEKCELEMLLTLDFVLGFNETRAHRILSKIDSSSERTAPRTGGGSASTSQKKAGGSIGQLSLVQGVVVPFEDVIWNGEQRS